MASRTTTKTGERPGQKGRLMAACVVVAVVVAIILAVVYFTPPEDGPLDPDEQATTSQPSFPEATVTLPTEAASPTVEELRKEAEQVAEDLQVRFPKLPEALHVAATLYAELQQTSQAEKLWRECIDLAPESVGPRVGLATVSLEQGNDQVAVDTLEQAIAIGCVSAEVYHNLSVALTKLGKLEEAEDVLEKGLVAFPGSPGNWFQLGQTQLQLKRFVEAESNIREAMARGAESPMLFFALANACSRQGKQEEAAEYRKRFAELKDKDASSDGESFQSTYANELRRIAVTNFSKAATVYSRLGEDVEAERLFLRAIALDLDNIQAYGELAAMYRDKGRFADVRVVQRQLVEIDPDNVVHYLNLASVSAQLRDNEAAETALKRAIDMRPDAVVAYLGLAQLYLQTGKPEQARLYAEGAVRRSPTVEGYLVLVAACEQLGDQAAAESAIETLRKLAPNDPRVNQVIPRRP